MTRVLVGTPHRPARIITPRSQVRHAPHACSSNCRRVSAAHFDLKMGDSAQDRFIDTSPWPSPPSLQCVRCYRSLRLRESMSPRSSSSWPARVPSATLSSPGRLLMTPHLMKYFSAPIQDPMMYWQLRLAIAGTSMASRPIRRTRSVE